VARVPGKDDSENSKREMHEAVDGHRCKKEPIGTESREGSRGRLERGRAEVPTAKWSELRYGLRGQLEDHDGEASQA
jgi:hypothetical protein